jgi:hypothetical protein
MKCKQTAREPVRRVARRLLAAHAQSYQNDVHKHSNILKVWFFELQIVAPVSPWPHLGCQHSTFALVSSPAARSGASTARHALRRHASGQATNCQPGNNLRQSAGRIPGCRASKSPVHYNPRKAVGHLVLKEPNTAVCASSNTIIWEWVPVAARSHHGERTVGGCGYPARASAA